MVIDLSSRLALCDGVLRTLQAAGWSLFTTLAVSSFIFGGLRSLIDHDRRTWASFFLSALACGALLGEYRDIVHTLVEAFSALTHYLAGQAGWADYWGQLQSHLSAMGEADDSSWTRLLGFMKGGSLGIVTSVSFFLQLVIWQLVGQLQGILLSLLYVLGPLMIACGIVKPSLLQSWLHSLIYVLLWGPILPFLMMLTVGASGGALASDNVAAVLCQNLVLVCLGLLTPVLAWFLIGAGGLSQVSASLMRSAQSLAIGAMLGGWSRMATESAPGLGTAAASLGNVERADDIPVMTPDVPSVESSPVSEPARDFATMPTHDSYAQRQQLSRAWYNYVFENGTCPDAEASPRGGRG